jgi:hypothetical protein
MHTWQFLPTLKPTLTATLRPVALLLYAVALVLDVASAALGRGALIAGDDWA